MNDFEKKDNFNNTSVEYTDGVDNGDLITEENKKTKEIYVFTIIALLLVVSFGVTGYFYINSDYYNKNSNIGNDNGSRTVSEDSVEDRQNINGSDATPENAENKVLTTETIDDEKQIISLILGTKESVENKNVEQFRMYAGDLPEDTTDEEILDQFDMLGWLFEDITEELLKSGQTSFDFSDNTAILEILIVYDEEEDYFETQNFYYVKENNEWRPTDSETIDVLRAEPIDNISEEIIIEPTSQETFNYYQLSINWAEGIEGKILLNDVEVFEEEEGQSNSSSRNLTEKILNKDGDNSIDLSVTSVSDDLGSLFRSDAFIEIIIYAVNEQTFPSEENELIKISVIEPQENNIRYKFKLGQ